jgi:multidrug efflux pump subunit AcrB
MKLGLSGILTRDFIDSPLSPLFLVAAFLVGALALAGLSREEEPQISVPLVDVHVRADGLKAVDAVELVTKPLEDIVKGINDVEHVYSQTVDDNVTVTARFFVGTDEDDAILRVHEELRAHFDRIPKGIPEPLVVGRGINDVPIVALVLTPRPEVAARWDDAALNTLARKLQHELIKVENLGLSFIVGGRDEQIRVEPDPERLSLYGITLNRLVEKLEHANRSFRVGALRSLDAHLPAVAGQTLQGIPDIGLLLLTTRDGRPVYVKDVARVVIGGAPDERRVWHMDKTAEGGLSAPRPAVVLALAKRKGANAMTVAEQILAHLERVRGHLVPEAVEVVLVRDYGETARDKANELLFHLGLATVAIVIIVALFIGWREGVVVLVVVPAIILLTFFASWLMGYTINRVSLFALIFSIGILVDDAIVVVENIVRHWRESPDENPAAVAVRAVAEVGNPTIVATLTVIAALLPMMFVSGLMGPYMSPIPANASAAMLFSFFVAVTITPWFMLRLRPRSARTGTAAGAHETGGVLGRLYLWAAQPLLEGRWRSIVFLAAVGLGTLASTALFGTRDVTVKLLPFDNKSELQVVVDLPEGSSLEATERALMALAQRLAGMPELTHIQAYAGTAAPFNFNGLVRHYYLRRSPELGDLQVNFLPKHARDRSSHELALAVRARLKDVALPEGTTVKVAEVPPGPPVLATLLAEVYGPDAETRRAAARRLRGLFEEVDFVVDTDDSFGQPAERLRFAIDQDNLEFHGVEEEAVYDTLVALLGGVRVGYSQRGQEVYPIEIALRLPREALFLSERLLATPVPGSSSVVELGDVVTFGRERASHPIFRHNGRFAEMVSGELAGRFEAPIYGMLAVEDAIGSRDWDDLGGPPAIAYHGQPFDESRLTFLWDGEWEVTYVTFRDMGLAFAVAILGIYLLVVGQFSNFKLPLVVLVPVPLTLPGIVLGHWAFSAAFTATSMIGFIALAGIIVRNSILLVDFVEARRAEGRALRPSLLAAGAIRFRPIFLTAIAAMVGAGFILLDPIFKGLAISLIFGLASSTILTVLVIPAIYVLLRDDGKGLEEGGTEAPPVTGMRR